MKSLFLEMIRLFNSKAVNVHFVKGWRDKQFGAAYTAAFISQPPNSDSEDGLYYIAGQDLFYIRYNANGKQYTKRLSVDQEEKLPKPLLMVIQEVVASRQTLRFVPEIKNRKNKQNEEAFPDRFLLLTGNRSTPIFA